MRPVPRPVWSAPGQPALWRVCLASGTQSCHQGPVEGLAWGRPGVRTAGVPVKDLTVVARVSQAGVCSKTG